MPLCPSQRLHALPCPSPSPAAGMPHAIMSSVTEVDGWCSVHSQADPHFVCEWPPRRPPYHARALAQSALPGCVATSTHKHPECEGCLCSPQAGRSRSTLAWPRRRSPCSAPCAHRPGLRPGLCRLWHQRGRRRRGALPVLRGHGHGGGRVAQGPGEPVPGLCPGGALGAVHVAG